MACLVVTIVDQDLHLLHKLPVKTLLSKLEKDNYPHVYEAHIVISFSLSPFACSIFNSE